MDQQHIHRLRTLRQRSGLSIRSLAKLAKVTPAMISCIELGKNSPSLATLQKILSAMGTDFASFFSGETPANDGPVFCREHMKLISDAERSYTIVFPRRPGVAVELLDEQIMPSRRPPSFERLACDVAGYVLAGVLELEVRRQPRRMVRAGDGFYIAKQIEHRGYASGHEPVRLITIYTPARY